MKKELAEYFIAFGIPGGPHGTMERVQIFIERAHDSTNPFREQYEDVIGRVMIALGKSLENRVEHNPARIFAGSVHKFLAACRVLEYITALKSKRVNVNSQTVEIYERFVDDLINIESEVRVNARVSPGLLFESQVGMTAEILNKGSHTTTECNKICLSQRNLRIGTEVYELQFLIGIAREIGGKSRKVLFDTYRLLLGQCFMKRDGIFPGLAAAIADRCATGIIDFKDGLKSVLKSGNLDAPGFTLLTAAMDTYISVKATAEEFAFRDLEADQDEDDNTAAIASPIARHVNDS